MIQVFVGGRLIDLVYSLHDNFALVCLRRDEEEVDRFHTLIGGRRRQLRTFALAEEFRGSKSELHAC